MGLVWELLAPGYGYCQVRNLHAFLTAVKALFVSPLRLFYRPKGQILLPFHILQLLTPLPIRIPEAFWAEHPRIGHYKECLPTPLRQVMRKMLTHLPFQPTLGHRFSCNGIRGSSPLVQFPFVYNNSQCHLIAKKD